jgi:hypothetical protein
MSIIKKLIPLLFLKLFILISAIPAFAEISPVSEETMSFDLGTTTMTTSLGRELTYTLNGGIRIPDSNNNPVVIFLHGSHPITNSISDRYDLGFSYLMDDLATQGYASVTLNVNIQYSFEDGEPIETERLEDLFSKHIQSLIDANNGETSNYPIDLTGKLDLSNIILIGHSRSGQSIFDLYKLLYNDFDIETKGLIAIAPSEMWLNDYENIKAPISIIVPELDGDVILLDGQRIFDKMVIYGNPANEIQLIYLYNSNHNAFNTAVTRQDSSSIPTFDPNAILISSEKQREFASLYICEITKRMIDNVDLYTLSGSNELFGFKAMVSSYISGQTLVNAGSNSYNISTSGNVNADDIIYSYMPSETQAGFFNHPGASQYIPLINIKWHDSNGTVNFNSDDLWNLKSYDILNIYIASDSTDELALGESKPFEIVLTDVSGNSSSYIIPNELHYIRFHPGELIVTEFSSFYSNFTPLGILPIPLLEFSDIDLENIVSIDFKLNQTKSGSLMLHSISAGGKAIENNIADNDSTETNHDLSSDDISTDNTSNDAVSNDSTNSLSITFILLISLSIIFILGICIVLHRKIFSKK